MNELYHYGVKGMKWGVRRAQKKYANKADRQAKALMENYKETQKILKSGNYAGEKLSKDDRKDIQTESETSIKNAKAWLKTRDDILSMNVSQITKTDIKNRFRNSGSTVYYPFA